MEATIKFPVLPGDSVFMLDDKKKIVKYVVDKISVLKDGSYTARISTADVSPSKTQSYEAVCPFEFGKTVFLTMEDAIVALRGKTIKKTEDTLICFDVNQPRLVSVKDANGLIHHMYLKLKELKFECSQKSKWEHNYVDDPFEIPQKMCGKEDIVACFETIPFVWDLYGNKETYKILIDPEKVSPAILNEVWRE